MAYHNDRPHTTHMAISTLTTKLEATKALLTESETQYQLAFAAGDFDACAFHKRQVAKYRNAVGRIIKQRMGMI